MSADPTQEYPSLLTHRQPEITGQQRVVEKGQNQVVHASAGPRAAFCAVSLKGHLRLAKAVAKELLGRGFTVDFLIGRDAEELHELDKQDAFNLHVIKEGGEMIGAISWQTVASSTGRLGGSRIALMEEIARGNTPERFDMCVKQWREMLRILETSKPDVIICDHAMQTFQVWAESQSIPSVILHTPYFATGKPGKTAQMTAWQGYQLGRVMRSKQPLAFFQKTSQALGIQQKMDKNFGEGAQGAGARKAGGVSAHTLIFCEPELLNCGMRELPERVHAVGPCLAAEVGQVDEDLKPWLDEAVEKGQRVVYVALGTLANGFLDERAARQMLSAFRKLGKDWRVLWSLPKEQQHLLEGLQDSQVKVASFVKQRAVLAHPAVSVFLSHGGQSSANESIFAGVPLVCMPLFCDQFEVADAVERHGLGLVFHKDELLSFWGRGGHRLATLLKSVAEEENFRSRIARHQHLMQLRSASQRAGQVVESIVQSGADYLELWNPVASRQDASGECAGGLRKCFEGLLKA